jgi:hypothetical protein
MWTQLSTEVGFWQYAAASLLALASLVTGAAAWRHAFLNWRKFALYGLLTALMAGAGLYVHW